MIHSIKCFSQVQEEHTTGTPRIHFLIYFIEEVDEAGIRGAALPEARLSIRKQIILLDTSDTGYGLPTLVAFLE